MLIVQNTLNAFKGYSNADMTHLYLVSDSEYSLLDYIFYCNDHMWPYYTCLESAVREGTSQNHCTLKMKTKKAEDLFQVVRCYVALFGSGNVQNNRMDRMPSDCLVNIYVPTVLPCV